MNDPIIMLDNVIDRKAKELNEALDMMESYVLNVSPHRQTILVEAETGTLGFTCRKDRWGIYLQVPGDMTLRDFSQMSITQRLSAVRAFPSLVKAIVEYKQKRLDDLNAVLDAADAVLGSLPKLPKKETAK